MPAIPRVIHQTWKNQNIPAEMLEFQQGWQHHHPDWEYRLWTDEDNRQFLQANYSWFLSIYDGYPENIFRVDAIRYFILSHYGGVFIDLDFECLHPLDELLEGKELVLGLEPAEHVQLPQPQARRLTHIVCPSLMASRVGHPFWQHVWQDLVESHGFPGVLDATGPFLLTRAYDTFPSPDTISLVASELLYPVTKFDCWDGKLNNPQFRQKITQQAFAIHHWHGSWFKQKSTKTEDNLPLSLMVKGRIILHAKFRFNLYQSLSSQEANQPLISCMMVTKNRFQQAKLAIECFQNQTYHHKELVIVDDDESDRLAEYVHQLADDTIQYLRLAPENRTLGELRNLALAHTSGTYVCQWDDDDLIDPLRLEMQMSALQSLNADACFLQRWLMWWVEQRRLATSRTRIWEGSILCHKSKLPAYPVQRQGEDTLVSSVILQNCRVALLDQPQLYLYVVHQQNTFGDEHFEQHWQQASARYQGINYETMIQNLAERMPVNLYEQMLEPIVSKQTRRHGDTETRRIEIPPHISFIPPEDNKEISASNQKQSGFLTELPKILILTPVKNAVSYLPQYLENLLNLDYPHGKISLGILESDSSDGSFDWLQRHLPEFSQEFSQVHLFKKDFQFHHSVPRWQPSIQFQRRSILAKSRNWLLQQSLQAEEWVLWLDVDVVEYPKEIIQLLLEPDKEIIVPNCVVSTQGRSFDTNTFKFKPGAELQDWSSFVIDGIIQPARGEGRLYLEDLRSHDIIQVDSVGATMLLIQADLHREGLIFPTFSYKLYIETEGLAMMAKDMGYTCWGLPQLEIVHDR
ncbi:MAG: glycosyltransferase [Symploca sp. SIO2C1]|nr:glycosyltransferase [Symploca sp. SIO2C1]